MPLEPIIRPFDDTLDTKAKNRPRNTDDWMVFPIDMPTRVYAELCNLNDLIDDLMNASHTED